MLVVNIHYFKMTLYFIIELFKSDKFLIKIWSKLI